MPRTKEELAAIGVILKNIEPHERFLIFCELERKVATDQPPTLIEVGMLVLTYVPDTTRIKRRVWPQSYWTLGLVSAVTKDEVTVREVTMRGYATKVKLEVPPHYIIPIGKPYARRRLVKPSAIQALQGRVAQELERLVALDKSLEVDLAPFTTDPEDFGLPMAPFLKQRQRLEQADSNGDEQQEDLKPWVTQNDVKVRQEPRPSSVRTNRRGRFGRKDR